MNLLLGWGDVNLDKPDNHGWTPLQFAARSGNDGAVESILRRARRHEPHSRAPFVVAIPVR